MGLAGPIASAAVMPYKGENQYLKSVFEPWKCSSPIPDTNLAPAILKSINVADTITMAGSNNLLLYVPWKTPYLAWRLYAFDNALQRYSLLRMILPTEDLTTNFYRIRHVAGGLKIQSATVNGGAFQISGTMSGIVFQNAPDVQQLTYGNLTQFHENDRSFVANLPIFNGIAALAQPYQDYDFVIPESVANLEEEDVFQVNWNNAIGSSTLASWVTGNVATAGTLFDTNTQPGVLPGTQWGHHELNLRANYTCAVVGGQCALSLIVTYASADPVTYARVLTIKQFDYFQGIVAIGEVFSPTFEVRTFDDREIVRIQILNSGAATVSIVATGAGNYARTELRYYNYSFNRLGASGPGAIIAWQGTSTGQQIALSMINHYEAVPNANLSKNVSSGMTKLQDPMDLEVAEFVLAHASEIGIRFMFPLSEYNDMSVNGQFTPQYDRENTVAQAGSIIDFARNAWNSFLRPVIRGAAPAIGSALGGLFGPQGASVGGMIGTGISNALSQTNGTKGPISYSDTINDVVMDTPQNKRPFWYGGYLVCVKNGVVTLANRYPTSDRIEEISSLSGLSEDFAPDIKAFLKALDRCGNAPSGLIESFLRGDARSGEKLEQLCDISPISTAYGEDHSIPLECTANTLDILECLTSSSVVNSRKFPAITVGDLIDLTPNELLVKVRCGQCPRLDGEYNTALHSGMIIMYPAVWKSPFDLDLDHEVRVEEHLRKQIQGYLKDNVIYMLDFSEPFSFGKKSFTEPPLVIGNYKDGSDSVANASTLDEVDYDQLGEDKPTISLELDKALDQVNKYSIKTPHAYEGDGTLSNPKRMLYPVKEWAEVGIAAPGKHLSAAQVFRSTLASGGLANQADEIAGAIARLTVTSNTADGKGTAFKLSAQKFATDCSFPAVVQREGSTRPEHLLESLIISSVPIAKMDTEKKGMVTPKYIISMRNGIEFNIDTDLYVDTNWTPGIWTPFGNSGNPAPWVTLMEAGKIEKIYITASHRISVVGRSWHAAFVAAFYMLPVGCALTGSEDATTISLSHKAATCLSAGLRLGIVRPSDTALEVLNEVVSKAGFAVLSGVPIVCVARRPMVFLLKDYASACLLNNVTAFSISALKVYGSNQDSKGEVVAKIMGKGGEIKTKKIDQDLYEMFPTRESYLKYIDDNLDVIDDIYDSKSKEDPDAYFKKIDKRVRSYYDPSNMMWEPIRSLVKNIISRNEAYKVTGEELKAKNRKKREKQKTRQAEQPLRLSAITPRDRIRAILKQRNNPKDEEDE